MFRSIVSTAILISTGKHNEKRRTELITMNHSANEVEIYYV